MADSTDRLGKYRDKPLDEAQVLALRPKQTTEYVACGGKDRVERLRLRRALAPTRSPLYVHLQDMAYDADHGTNFVLVYDFMMVLVRGQNLQGIITAIENGTAAFIQEYHPDIWEKKPADDAPIIDSLQIILNGVSESEPAGEASPS